MLVQHAAMNWALDAPGLQCTYRHVVASEAWPSVCCTTCTGAPRSMAWDAWACRHQCIENVGGNPARRAACLTMECMVFTDNALLFRLRKIGAESVAPSRSAATAEAM
jgi:hypothetical protein